MLITEQSDQLQTLKQIVRGTEQFRLAEVEGKLLRLPAGDGGALVFRTSPEAPVRCAVEISQELKRHPELRVRMGIHSGPVNEITDLNGFALQLKGDLPAAITEYKKAQQLSDDLIVQVLLATAKVQSGDRDAAIQMLAELEELSQHRYVSSYWRTLLYLSLGNRNEAIRQLERAIADHESLTITLIKVDPVFDPLRGDPCFEALVQQVVGPKQK